MFGIFRTKSSTSEVEYTRLKSINSQIQILHLALVALQDKQKIAHQTIPVKEKEIVRLTRKRDSKARRKCLEKRFEVYDSFDTRILCTQSQIVSLLRVSETLVREQHALLGSISILTSTYEQVNKFQDKQPKLK